MKSIKPFLLIALLLLAVAPHTLASSEFQEIHVISLVPDDKPDRYTIVFDAATTDYGERRNLPREVRRFTVLLRCEPRFCTLDEYREAIQLLQRRLSGSPDITIARMSATGWRPVSSRRGVFESVGLRVPKPPKDYKGAPALLFLHDDRF